MSKEQGKIDFSNRDTINIYSPQEIQYWCDRFAISTADLKKAVAAVGPQLVNVKKLLKVE